jgi:carboxylesterase type B
MVTEYLGIRFGETTGGGNRFMPPKRYTGGGTVQASKFVSIFKMNETLLTTFRDRK